MWPPPTPTPTHPTLPEPQISQQSASWLCNPGTVGGQDDRTNTFTVPARSLGTLGLCFSPSQIVSLTMGTTLEQKENNQTMINKGAGWQSVPCGVAQAWGCSAYQFYTFNHTGDLNQSFPLLSHVERGDRLKQLARERDAIQKTVQWKEKAKRTLSHTRYVKDYTRDTFHTENTTRLVQSRPGAFG